MFTLDENSRLRIGDNSFNVVFRHCRIGKVTMLADSTEPSMTAIRNIRIVPRDLKDWRDGGSVPPSHNLPNLDHYVSVTVDLTESGRVKEVLAIRASEFSAFAAEFPTAAKGGGIVVVEDPFAEVRHQIQAHRPKDRV